MAQQMNAIDLTNRHAIVTGGAQGIGFSVAKRFLASGASVTIWDRDEDLLAAAVRSEEPRLNSSHAGLSRMPSSA